MAADRRLGDLGVDSLDSGPQDTQFAIARRRLRAVPTDLHDRLLALALSV
jgi:hypothetical protein